MSMRPIQHPLTRSSSIWAIMAAAENELRLVASLAQAKGLHDTYHKPFPQSNPENGRIKKTKLRWQFLPLPPRWQSGRMTMP